MANKLDPMDLKQIISLRLDGLSNRKIAELLGIGRNTVNAYMKLFNACGLPLSELKELGNHELQELFPSRTIIDNPRYERLINYFNKVNHARDHPGFTFHYH
ncbi:MAG: helix-turn-helix domain-containing protein, partial [Cryomorphaceae bacterium]